MATSSSRSQLSNSKGVVIWEWLNEYSRWMPYEPHVSNYIEHNYNAQNPQVYLGHVESALSLYILDFGQMTQIRQGTGMGRGVRRTVYPPSSPAAQGLAWQWEGDTPGNWHSYDLEISCTLEEAFSKKLNSVDLSLPPLNMPYKICLTTMTQIRMETKRSRTIRRELLSGQYCLDSGQTRTVMGNSNGFWLFPNSINAPFMPGAGGSSGIAVPPKKRIVSDLTDTVSSRSTAAPYSLRKKTHIKPQNLTQRSSAPPSSLPSGSLGAANNPYMTGAVPPLTVPLPRGNSVLGPYSGMPGFTGQTGIYSSSSAAAVGFHSSLFTTSASVPGNLSAATARPSVPIHTSIHPVMGKMSNVLMTPVVPNIHTLTSSYSMPTSHSSHSVPVFRPPSMSRSKSDNLGQHKGPVRIRNDIWQSHKGKKSAEDVLQKFVQVLTDSPKDEDCCICCEKLNAASGYCNSGSDAVVYKLKRCTHMFHRLCLREMYDSGHQDGSIQCPTCKAIYGEKSGNCPRGEMEYEVLSDSLPGHPHCGTIQIIYNIRPGTQGGEHPHPGKRYSTRGFPRVGYFPDDGDGNKVLKLLIIAWKRRLTFTIGQSTTTGESDTVTWNEIHHKTEFGSNVTGHGYPDPKYMDNVLLELAMQGVTETDLDG